MKKLFITIITTLITIIPLFSQEFYGHYTQSVFMEDAKITDVKDVSIDVYISVDDSVVITKVDDGDITFYKLLKIEIAYEGDDFYTVIIMDSHNNISLFFLFEDRLFIPTGENKNIVYR